MKALAAALVAAQAEMPAVEPDAVNPHYKTKFVSLDHLIAKTRPVLNRHGLAITQLPAVWEGAPVLRTTLIHGPSGESLVADAPLILARNDMQGLGAAITYARRYAWAAALGIAGDEDNDGEPPPPPSRPVSRAASSPAAEPRMISDAQRMKLHALLSDKGIDDRDAKITYCSGVIGRSIGSSKELTRDEARRVIDHLDQYDHANPQTWPFPTGY